MATTSTPGSAPAASQDVGAPPGPEVPGGGNGAAPGGGGRRAGRPRRSPLAKQEDRAGWLFVLPWVLGFLIFTAGPMIASLVLSFTDYQMIQAPRAVGLENYRELFDDPRVLKSLSNTFVYAAMFVPIGTIVALFLALMLQRVGRAGGFFRTAFYLPEMTPAVAAAAMFLLLLNGQQGLVNKVLGWIGINGPNWTADPNWLKPSLAIVSLWTLGGTVVIYLAALNGVPKQLYEAAELDGAGPVTRLFRITIPMISGALFFTVITNTIAAMQMFDQAYTMFYGPQQKASASEESLVYMVYLFQNAFQFFKMGFASAMAWLLFVIILLITFLQVRIGNRYVYYHGER
ncbi:sugar ABC transporter permease [Kribbella sp. HUAS MG21]|uniref:Sugar ABC transporter permease n=1 Tax=Kribbella sp. HUAS MG21 TaxID=3160966 RepID=A0AAU7TII9_9ACTN